MSEFRMPALGADMAAGTLVAWRHKPGDRLVRGDIIAEVETDKGVIEVEVYGGGVLSRLLVEPGQKVPVGTALAILSESSDAGPAEQPGVFSPPAPARDKRNTPGVGLGSDAPVPPMAAVVREPGAAAPEEIRASPAARRRARELGIDLATIGGLRTLTRGDVERAATQTSSAAMATPHLRASPAARKRAHQLGVDLGLLQGTGPALAITLQDVERAAPPPTAAESAKPPATTTTGTAPLADRQRALRRAIGAAMSRAKREIPHYYLGTTVDLGAATTWLAARNAAHSVQERVLIGALLLKAVALAAQRMPDFNARFVNGQVEPQSDVHLGVAIALRGGGLVAPAIHNADHATLDALMAELQDLVARTRAGSLRSSELSDGTITVTSLGERGVETVFPIIYPPQTAIVGFGRVVERPWVSGGALCVRPLVHATLAADHRVTDGHLGARFLALVEALLQEPEKL